MADQWRGGVVGLRQWSALADLVEDMIADTIDVVFDETFAFLAERHRQLQQSFQHPNRFNLFLLLLSFRRFNWFNPE